MWPGPSALPDHDSYVKRQLLLFAKLPEAGRAKTRLNPVLGASGAAQLYAAFLDDSVALAGAIQHADVRLWIQRSPGAERAFRSRYPGVSLRWQAEGNLGERMTAAFEAAFAEGADTALLMGSDHPTLPAEFLLQGFEELDRSAVVIGPSEDGGYYAVGLQRGAWPKAARLFEGIPWSTPEVLHLTRHRARQVELSLAELPEWYDVDEPAQLSRLQADVSRASQTGRALRNLLHAGKGEH